VRQTDRQIVRKTDGQIRQTDSKNELQMDRSDGSDRTDMTD
jgi:hypothetical protein